MAVPGRFAPAEAGLRIARFRTFERTVTSVRPHVPDSQALDRHDIANPADFRAGRCTQGLRHEPRNWHTHLAIRPSV